MFDVLDPEDETVLAGGAVSEAGGAGTGRPNRSIGGRFTATPAFAMSCVADAFSLSEMCGMSSGGSASSAMCDVSERRGLEGDWTEAAGPLIDFAGSVRPPRRLTVSSIASRSARRTPT